MIYALFKHLNKDFKIIKILPQKATARNPFSAVVEVENEKKFVVIASSDIQKFYLKRSIEKQKEFYEDFSPYFKFNFPESFGNYKYGENSDELHYAVYPYIENLKWCEDERPIKIIEEIYSKHAKTYKMAPELLNKIQEDFLSSWSEEFHQKIKSQPLYKEYFEKISRENEVKIYKEYGDYTVNNILDDGKKLWLMNFEFAKSFQVIDHDLHDYKRTLAMRYLDKQNLSKLKEKMLNKTNNILDDTNNLKQKKNLRSIFKRLFHIEKLRWGGVLNVGGVPSVNELKIHLFDNANKITDNSFLPTIEIIKENKENYITNVFPNFTYNRFDVRFGNDYEIYKVTENKQIFYIPYHIKNDTCILGICLTPISKKAFDLIIEDIFRKNNNVVKIQARYSLNQYEGLKTSNHWRVELPEHFDEFLSKLSAKSRYNAHWYPKKIKESLGGYEIKKYERAEITEDIVNEYFEFKKMTHGTDYNMSPTEYLDSFYVTHAYVMYISGEIEAVIFICLVNDIAYLDNLSFNLELNKFSLGTVLYLHLINDLIKGKIKYLYLGGGRQEYKKRFNGINQLCYDGYFINRPLQGRDIGKIIKNLVKKFKNKTRKVVCKCWSIFD